MVGSLRNGIMLLTLLLVVIGGTGMVSVCPCHKEIFIFSCSCHQKAAPCECHGDQDPCVASPSLLDGHRCEHRQLEIDDLTVPILRESLPRPYVFWQTLPDFHHLPPPLLLTGQTSDSAIPAPPDLFRRAGSMHEGFQLPLLI